MFQYCLFRGFWKYQRLDMFTRQLQSPKATAQFGDSTNNRYFYTSIIWVSHQASHKSFIDVYKSYGTYANARLKASENIKDSTCMRDHVTRLRMQPLGSVTPQTTDTSTHQLSSVPPSGSQTFCIYMSTKAMAHIPMFA